MGGLGLIPYDIGMIMGIFGACNALVQTFFGGRIIHNFGPRRIFNAAFCALVLAYATYPLNTLAKRAGRIDVAVIAVLVCQSSCSFVLSPAVLSPAFGSVDGALRHGRDTELGERRQRARTDAYGHDDTPEHRALVCVLPVLAVGEK
ncbi:hypothetical protein FB451DRAFT_299245 [Mycena latifolia]|nr:hypothetical protein FB451DRAFT_299245 [Mycena latifolia]